MNKQMLGIIDASLYKTELEPLTNYRTVSAIPFAGRYRFVDFMLSNLVGSGIHSVALFPKVNDRSLLDHLGSGKDWDLNRKRDGLFIFPPMSNSQSNPPSIISQLRYHINYFLRSTQKYVVVTNSRTICNINFADVLNHHIDSGADITEVCYQGEALQIYVLEKELLMDLIHQDKLDAQTLSDLIHISSSQYVLSSYEHKGYTAVISDIPSYFKRSMEILDPKVWKQVFMAEQPVYTKVKDEPPTHYTKTAVIKNSLIANGCVIEGHVENSIIFRGVKIEKGAVVKNSIVMQKSCIKENSLLNYVILDKDVKVESNVDLTGSKEQPFVIGKGTIQGALMNS